MKYINYLCVGMAFALSACSQSDKSETAVAVAEELPRVTTGIASEREVPQTKIYTANVEAENINNISPSVMNRIKTINVEVGDPVRAGQTLVTLDSSNSDQLRINMEQVEREYNRAKNLLEIGSGTQQSVDQLKSQLDALKSQYKNMLENTVLVSPISGVVTARNYDPGDMTGAMPVLTVGQITPVVKVMININESDLKHIEKGMPVEVSFDAYPGETFEGKIIRQYPTVDVATRTFPAEVRISNPNGRIKPGMFARVNINLGSQTHTIVPDRAVVKQSGSGNKYVYVYSDGKVSYNKVELGQRLDDGYEILSGVNNGDVVVLTGQTRLADGVEVEVVDHR